MILSILICSLKERQKTSTSLLLSLMRQLEDIKGCDTIIVDSTTITRYFFESVEIVIAVDDRNITTGAKRNLLVKNSNGQYVCFIDDDDEIPSYYLEEILKSLKSLPDCLSLIGEITFDGANPRTFIHSAKYNSYFEKDNVYYRCPNHLNVIRKSISSQIKFPEKNYSEDTDFAMALCKSGLIKTEVEVSRVIYYYKFINKK